MPVFTAHAYERFINRRPDLKGVPQQRHRWEELAHESFLKGRPITREEAESRIRARLRQESGFVYYRTDGTGPGIWVSRWIKHRELVITYLAPRYIRGRRRCRWLGFKRVRLWPVTHKRKSPENVIWYVR